MVHNPKRLFNKSYAPELLHIAVGDSISAKTLYSSSNPGRPENIVYLVQQSVEKSLKAVLVHLQISFPLIHDLGVLIALLPDEHLPKQGFNLTELNPFASVRRYEEGKLPLTNEEIEIALETAEDILNWATQIIQNQ